jgi:hypothetical protein
VEFVIVLVILAVVVLVITGPLRRAARSPERDESPAPDPEAARALAELEASREAKYREIRDAELDHRTGKLSDADYQAIDRTLRAEAIEILHELDRVSEREPRPPPG